MTEFARRRNGIELPEQVTIRGIKRRQKPSNSELPSTNTYHDAVCDGQRGFGHRIALAVVGNLGDPALFAGVGIECDEVCIDRGDEDCVAEDCYATIWRCAAKGQSI